MWSGLFCPFCRRYAKFCVYLQHILIRNPHSSVLTSQCIHIEMIDTLHLSCCLHNRLRRILTEKNRLYWHQWTLSVIGPLFISFSFKIQKLEIDFSESCMNFSFCDFFQKPYWIMMFYEKSSDSVFYTIFILYLKYKISLHHWLRNCNNWSHPVLSFFIQKYSS